MTHARLTAAQEKFVLHWGEMGAKWGVNRTVAQIHALLFLSKKPLTAEEIAETLSVARSNVSVSLRELLGWKLVRPVPILGDRREHFEAHKDVWEMFKVILDGRKQREIDPTLQLLRECVAQTEDPHTSERMRAMAEFFEAADHWYNSVRPLPSGVAKRLMKLGGKVSKILAGGLLLVVGMWSASEAQLRREPRLATSDTSFADTLTKSDEFKKIIKIGVAQYFQSHTVSVKRRELRALPASAPRFTAELAPLRNRQWSAASFFPMGGVRTSLSGQFSRKRNAYFAVFPDGAQTPAFVSINDLIDGDAGVLVNGVEYRLSLVPVMFDRLASKVMVRRASDGQTQGVTMKRILDHVYTKGLEFPFEGRKFRLFYGQDAEENGDGAAAGPKESVCLLLPYGTEYMTYLIPLELVPADNTVGVFPLNGAMSLTLRNNNGILEAY